MWRLKSLSGLMQLIKYIHNWYSVIAAYLKIIPKTKARFKDGMEVQISRSNTDDFHEQIFRRYLQDKGFS
jgi:hypothetical protein